MRLMLTPLIRSLKSILGLHPFLVYMDSFRYPLAGEFSLDLDLVRRNRIPADWGLEVGLLADVFRNSAAKGICQVELCENYDHKHQELSARDAERGLNKMAVDIAKSIFRTMAAEGSRRERPRNSGSPPESSSSTWIRASQDRRRAVSEEMIPPPSIWQAPWEEARAWAVAWMRMVGRGGRAAARTLGLPASVPPSPPIR